MDQTLLQHSTPQRKTTAFVVGPPRFCREKLEGNFSIITLRSDENEGSAAKMKPVLRETFERARCFSLN